MKKVILVIVIMCLTGCIQICPTIQTTKSYEGHFYNAAEVKAVVEKIELQKGESVWILSNTTLKRVLKNGK